jgi:hypothetical protein
VNFAAIKLPTLKIPVVNEFLVNVMQCTVACGELQYFFAVGKLPQTTPGIIFFEVISAKELFDVMNFICKEM